MSKYVSVSFSGACERRRGGREEALSKRGASLCGASAAAPARGRGERGVVVGVERNPTAPREEEPSRPPPPPPPRLRPASAAESEASGLLRPSADPPPPSSVLRGARRWRRASCSSCWASLLLLQPSRPWRPSGRARAPPPPPSPPRRLADGEEGHERVLRVGGWMDGFLGLARSLARLGP